MNAAPANRRAWSPLLLGYVGLVMAVTVIDNPFTAPFNDYEPFTETLGPYLYANLKAWTGLPVPFSAFEWWAAILALKGVLARRLLPRDPQRSGWSELSLLTAVVVGFLTLSALLSVYVLGGDATATFWALKGPAVIPLMLVATATILRTPDDYRRAGMALVIGVTLKAAQGLYYYHSVLGGNLGKLEYITTHAGSHMMSAALLVIMLPFFFRDNTRQSGQRGWLLAAACIITPAFVYNERRVEVLGLFVCIAVMLAAATARSPRRMVKRAVIITVIIGLYAFGFGNISGPLGAPARLVASLSDQDNASNLYRDIENYNLVTTLLAEPVFGQGMGKAMDEVIRLPDISALYALYLVNPHNAVLWLWMATGVVGMVLFMSWLGAYVAHASIAFFRCRSSLDALLLVFAVANIIRFLLSSYGDMMLFNSECCFMLGTSLGLIVGAVARQQATAPLGAARAPVGAALRA